LKRPQVLVLWVALMGVLGGCRDATPPTRTSVSPSVSKSTGHDARAATHLQLVDAVKQIASDYSRGISPTRVQSLFDAVLVSDGRELHGESKQWPVALNLIVPRSDLDTPLLRLGIGTASGLTLGDIERIFGKHGPPIRAKESMVEFEEPLGIPDFRVVVSVLGGASSSAPVLRIEMERTKQ
jgi:hypothetical protein